MSKNFLKCLLISICVILIAWCQKSEQYSATQRLFDQAKEKFLQKEKEYLRAKPLSRSLRSFLTDYRRIKRADNLFNNFMETTMPPEILKNNNGFDFAEFTKGFSNLLESGSSPQKSKNLVRDAHGDMSDLDESTKLEEIVESVTISLTDKPEDKMLLDQVVNDVDKLIKYKKEGKLAGNEGALCNVNGFWDSEAGGMQLNISSSGGASDDCSGIRKIAGITMQDRIPQFEDGFLCDEGWTLSGILPFSHSTVIIITALHNSDKKAATFIGECRICEGTETIAGEWMLGRAAKDCKDRDAAHVILSDIWRKNNIRNLQVEHLKTLNLSVT